MSRVWGLLYFSNNLVDLVAYSEPRQTPKMERFAKLERFAFSR